MLKNSSEQKKFFALIKHVAERDRPLTRSTAYYQDLYNHFGLGKWFLSWNWATFLWGVGGIPFGWFLYRRMYLYGFLLWVLQSLIISILLWMPKLVNVEFIVLKIGMKFVGMLLALVGGMFANTLYFHFLKRRITDPATSFPTGGTNWVIVVIIGVGIFIQLNILYHHLELMPPEIKGLFSK